MITKKTKLFFYLLFIFLSSCQALLNIKLLPFSQKKNHNLGSKLPIELTNKETCEKDEKSKNERLYGLTPSEKNIVDFFLDDLQKLNSNELKKINIYLEKNIVGTFKEKPAIDEKNFNINPVTKEQNSDKNLANLCNTLKSPSDNQLLQFICGACQLCKELTQAIIKKESELHKIAIKVNTGQDFQTTKKLLHLENEELKKLNQKEKNIINHPLSFASSVEPKELNQLNEKLQYGCVLKDVREKIFNSKLKEPLELLEKGRKHTGELRLKIVEVTKLIESLALLIDLRSKIN